MNTFETNKANLEAYEFKLVTWDEFVKVTDLPDGLLNRAENYHETEPFEYIVYDPIDDEDGFMLFGNDPEELASDTCKYISEMEPEEGPLAV